MTCITAVMDRQERLISGLDNWYYDSPIIVVDWSSKVALLPDSRMILIRIEGESYFSQAKAFNLAASFVSENQVILKLDVDYRFQTNSMTRVSPNLGEFVTGKHNDIIRPEDTYLNGLLIVRKSDFESVNGYNERLTCYGYDDDDLYVRLQSSGLKRRTINSSSGIIHLAHSDEDRTKLMKTKGETLQAGILNNQNLCKAEPWTCLDRRQRYDLRQIDARHFIGRLI